MHRIMVLLVALLNFSSCLTTPPSISPSQTRRERTIKPCVAFNNKVVCQQIDVCDVLHFFWCMAGPNFLLDGRVYLNAPMRMHGNTYSTFLGMDEIRRCVQAANGSVSIQFYTDTVETKISMPAKAGAAQKVALKKSPKGANLPPLHP